MVKTTIYLPEDLHEGVKRAAKERGTSEAELIRAAVRHELLGMPADQAARAGRRARLLAAMGELDSSVYRGEGCSTAETRSRRDPPAPALS